MSEPRVRNGQLTCTTTSTDPLAPVRRHPHLQQSHEHSRYRHSLIYLHRRLRTDKLKGRSPVQEQTHTREEALAEKGRRRERVGRLRQGRQSYEGHFCDRTGIPARSNMARSSRRAALAAAFLLLLAPLTVHAQLSDVPDLATATETSATSVQSTDGGQTTAQTTAQTVRPTATTGGTDTGTTTEAFVGTATDNAATVTNAPSLTTGGATSIFHLSGAPTIAGAGIPELFIPWTAGAPFMQKSSLPEGTVFIAVGAVLAFLGVCVLLWRATVAWSINRSVKRAALVSVGAGGEKSSWGAATTTSGGYRSISQNKASLYKDAAGSNMSLDQLTSAGKPMKPHFRDSSAMAAGRSTTPPADLFFSPTAKLNNTNHRDSAAPSHRNSGYMPSGYYASPSAAPAGGAPGTTLGGDGHHSIAPYANRHSYMNAEPSPPSSPGLPATRSSAGNRGSRDGLRAPPSREGRRSYLSAEPRSGHSSALYAQPSSSSLMVGSNSVSDLGGSRAPSAYFEDLLENHGSGPRERF